MDQVIQDKILPNLLNVDQNNKNDKNNSINCPTLYWRLL